MLEIRPIKPITKDAKIQVIFVHGFKGGIEKTWNTDSDGKSALWPTWLKDQISDINVWLIEYSSNYLRKSADKDAGLELRSNLILKKLKTKMNLNSGKFFFVGHSHGGNLIKQLLKTIDENVENSQFCEDFLSRIGGCVFYDTPHKGTDIYKHVKWLVHGSQFLLFAPGGGIVRRVVRFGVPLSLGALWLLKSREVRELDPNNTYIIQLRDWYLNFCSKNGVANLNLLSKNERYVKLADLDGFKEDPIVIEEGHGKICKPDNRKSLTYSKLVEFIQSET